MKTSPSNYLIKKLKKKFVKKKFVPLHEPLISNHEKDFITECIESRYFSTSGGKFIDLFEQQIRDYTGSKYVCLTNSGTSALHASLIASGIKKDDEVIVPSISFVATANAVAYCGAIPYFIDVEEKNFTLDSDLLEYLLKSQFEMTLNGLRNKNTGRRLSAIIPVHVFGHPCNIEKISNLSKKYNLKLIEDAAESLGSYYRSTHTGIFGDFGILSFNGNKIITTGSGGAILCQNQNNFKKVSKLISILKRKHKWRFYHDDLGYNYKMANINACLGSAQIEKIQLFLKKKRNLYLEYKNLFLDNDNFRLVDEPLNCKSNFWLQSLHINCSFEEIQKMLNKTNAINISTRLLWHPLNLLPHFKHSPTTELQNTKKIYKKVINIPSSANLNSL